MLAGDGAATRLRIHREGPGNGGRPALRFPGAGSGERGPVRPCGDGARAERSGHAVPTAVTMRRFPVSFLVSIVLLAGLRAAPLPAVRHAFVVIAHRGDHTEDHEEDPAVHRRADPDVAHPSGTPREVIVKLNRETARILDTPEMRDYLQREGMDAAGGTPEDFSAHFKAEIAKWGKVVREAGIKAE